MPEQETIEKIKKNILPLLKKKRTFLPAIWLVL